MKILWRYLLKQNLFYMMICLGLGTVIYLLSDVFDRLDDFLEAGLGAGTVLTYFAVKIPLIFSQILPAVFLIALIVQLGLLARSRELLALQAGGISYARLAVFFVIYALAWSTVQFTFSQALGVRGLEMSSRIWAEQVRDRKLERETVRNVWFREGTSIIWFKEARPAEGTGKGLTIYKLADNRQSLAWIATAPSFHVDGDRWVLDNAEMFTPGNFGTEVMPEMSVAVSQDLTAFSAIKHGTDPAQLPIWQLSKVIESLKRSGSNVESLLTAWHSKLAYAFSILAMALLALAVTSLSGNVYLNLSLSLLLTFIYYGFYIIGATLGQKGMVPPIVGAWLGNAIVTLAALSRIVWISSK